MLDFTTSEISMLVDDGYIPGWMKDIRESDLIAIPPVSRTPIWNDPEKDGDRHMVRTLKIQSVFSMNASYHDFESDEMVPNEVITFIGVDLDGLPRHEQFSSSYPCFIKREAI